MKKIIYKTNQYLLERYPTIWNTRLVWMLLSALILHSLFFFVGLLTLTNPAILHERFIKNIFFENGAIYFTTMISLLLLVGWLIYMFKNNAFKNFYPTSHSKLFGQFICYILILLSCSSFYLSYNYGMKTYITISYSDDQINNEIEIANDVAMFFSENVEEYTIDNRKYPQHFFDLYCETTDDFIDKNLPHETFLAETYQYYTLKTKEVATADLYLYANENNDHSTDSTLTKFVYSERIDDISVLYIKDSVVDIKPYINTIKPNYYNASFTFFISRNDTLFNDNNNYYNSKTYDYYENNNYNTENTLRKLYRNKRNSKLLDRNDKTEINQLIDKFLKFSKYYKIPHNITAKGWTDLVYYPSNFEVTHFIRDEPKDEYDNSSLTIEKTKFEQYYLDRVTDYYYDHSALENVFENIEDIKASTPFKDSIHFFIWFAFFFASILFMFRTTGLKPLLFSIITVGVLALIIALLGTFLSFVITTNYDIVAYLLLYFLLVLGLIILIIPTVFADYIHKTVVGICVNISIIGFPLYLLLIVGLITMHQDNACRARTDYYTSGYRCDTLYDLLEFNWSYVFFIAALVFLFFFSKAIKKWKSLPEG